MTAFQPEILSGNATSSRQVHRFDRYYLTRERDIPRQARVRPIVGAAIVAASATALAWHDVASGHAGPLLEVGLGRAAGLLDRGGWPGGWLLSAFESLHIAGLAVWLALTLWFGATRRPAMLPGEELIFFRRQSPWIAANAATGGGLCFVVGQLLAAWELPLLSVPIEVVGLSLLCSAGWQALVPEARVALAVILDGAKLGWGNRAILSGGPFRVGRLTLRKDDFHDASARDTGGLEMLGHARSLTLRVYLPDGTLRTLRIRGISHDPEIGVLASILNGIFTLGLTREALRDTIRLNRLPAGLEF